MVRPRVSSLAQLDNLLYRSKRNVFISNYSTLNPLEFSGRHVSTRVCSNPHESAISFSISLKSFTRNIYISRKHHKNLDSFPKDGVASRPGYFSIPSHTSQPDSSLLIDKYPFPSLDLRPEDSLINLPEQDSQLENVKSVFMERENDIAMWLKTNKHCYIKDIDDSVVQVFRDADRFASIHGLLLADVSLEDMRSHVAAAGSTSELFTPEFMRRQKRKLYGDNELPLLAVPDRALEHNLSDQSHHSEPESDPRPDEDRVGIIDFLNQKRQQLIEKLSFSEALETAKVEASSLLDFKHPSELSALSRTCSQWIQDISSFIKRDREKGDKSVIPLELEEELLATTTVKIVLQSMCFPSYTLDWRGNKGGFMKKRIQQTTSNQILISHLAIKLGDEVGKLYSKICPSPNPATGHTQEPGEMVMAEGADKAMDEANSEYIAIERRATTKAKNVTVKSTLKSMMEPMDAEIANYKNWNSSQSAAVGGYLLNALIKSCKIELDLQTALKQYLASYSHYFNNQGAGKKKQGLPNQHKGQRNISHKEVDTAVSVGDGLMPTDAMRTTDTPPTRDKLDVIMRFLSAIKKSRFNESLVEVEAFRHVLLRQGMKTFGVLEMRESCMLQLRDFVAKSLLSLAALPMVCKPKRWINATTGGSLLLKHNFIRGSKLNEVRVYDLDGVFEVVNKFSQVPWVINADLLRLVKEVNNTPNYIPIKQYVPYNPTPIGPTVTDISMTTNTRPTLARFDSEGNQVGTEKLDSNELSELSLFLRRIKIADSFVNERRLYMPLNIDFRGRMYPLSPYLNHMNDDLCRSLLLFADRRRLGERGLFWLKVHTSNMYGNDKKSFAERVRWAEEHLPIMKDLVRNPWGDFNQNFWARADKPFQFFAACLELTRAYETDDPTGYCTNLPVQQDGTCNGLQHYAALGLDVEGARYVNLVDAPEPQDLYSHILQVVIQKVYQDLNSTPHPAASARDSAEGVLALTEALEVPVPPKMTSKVVSSKKKNVSLEAKRHAETCVNNNLLSRKVIKQTVMTICYGVTRIGAIDQVQSKLKDIKKIAHLPENELRGLAAYLAGKILSSISSVFSGAMGIKNWLDDISLLHNRFNVPVTWTSPIGLPCEQPYCLSVTKTVRTPLQSINVSRYVPGVDKRRQKLAFPPNFVHSLDAAHLMLTAQRMFSHTDCFAAVHDSFWVHPDRVDIMHRFIRDEFFLMHSRPILDDLHKSVVDRLQVPFRPPPPRGSLDLAQVLHSTYFFH